MCQHEFHCIAIIDNGCIPFQCSRSQITSHWKMMKKRLKCNCKMEYLFALYNLRRSADKTFPLHNFITAVACSVNAWLCTSDEHDEEIKVKKNCHNMIVHLTGVYGKMEYLQSLSLIEICLLKRECLSGYRIEYGCITAPETRRRYVVM